MFISAKHEDIWNIYLLNVDIEKVQLASHRLILIGCHEVFLPV